MSRLDCPSIDFLGKMMMNVTEYAVVGRFQSISSISFPTLTGRRGQRQTDTKRNGHDTNYFSTTKHDYAFPAKRTTDILHIPLSLLPLLTTHTTNPP